MTYGACWKMAKSIHYILSWQKTPVLPRMQRWTALWTACSNVKKHTRGGAECVCQGTAWRSVFWLQSLRSSLWSPEGQAGAWSLYWGRIHAWWVCALFVPTIYRAYGSARFLSCWWTQSAHQKIAIFLNPKVLRAKNYASGKTSCWLRCPAVLKKIIVILNASTLFLFT